MLTNERHKMFADLYLKDKTRNARKAYQQVYPKTKASAADTSAGRLLKNVEVKKYINEVERKATEKVKLTSEDIVRELCKLAFFDMRKLFNKDGTPKRIQEIDDDTACAIIGVEILTKSNGTKTWKYKLSSRQQALDALAKIRNLFANNSDPSKNGFLIEVRDYTQATVDAARKKNAGTI